MMTTNPFDASVDDDDKLREECGIFGVSDAEGAAAMVALGLHALQHRGQEAAGITSFNGHEFRTHRANGHVAGNFDSEEVIGELVGSAAIGHVRYATTGGAGLRNVQPLFADLSTGGFAIAHNGFVFDLNGDSAATIYRVACIDGEVDEGDERLEQILRLGDEEAV